MAGNESFKEAIAALPDLSEEQMAGMRFVDVEASGLHKTSYPIEVAWCGLDLLPVSMLIRPMPQWGLQDWSLESEKVHGISRDQLFDEGVEARACAESVAGALAGRMVFSDAPRFDASWLMTLFSAAGVRPGFDLREVEDAQALCARKAERPLSSIEQMYSIMEDVGGVYRHTHRAGDDSLRMAAQCRGLYDARWRRSLSGSVKRGGLPPL